MALPLRPDDELQSPSPVEPLVPLPRVEQALGDPVALATWHEALSDALATDIPHDLLGLWLYPAEGGAVLLGPEALAQDELAVPLPTPQLQQRQLDLIEEIVRDAGYGSVACLPVRFGRRDVGLLLTADLRPGRYGSAELVLLTAAARRLAPALGRMARQWSGVHGGARSRSERLAGLVEVLAEAATAAGTPQRYVAALSRALEPLLPHDQLELLLADPEGNRSFRLTEHAGGPLWRDPSLVVPADVLDPALLLDAEGRVVLGDAVRHPHWPRGYFVAAEPPGAELRAVAGARFSGPGGVTGYLLAGSVGPDLYDAEDADLLARVGALVGGLVAAFARVSVDRPMAAPPRDAGVPALLLEAAEALATTPEPSDATRRLAELAARALPIDGLQLAVRLLDGDRVVLLPPGERRALPDLPLIPVTGTPLGRVLLAEVASAFEQVAGEVRLIVPLRVAGRVHGALVLTAAMPAVLNPAHTRAAQQLADVVAPHLELLRRAALLPPPFHPGWKREPKVP